MVGINEGPSLAQRTVETRGSTGHLLHVRRTGETCLVWVGIRSNFQVRTPTECGTYKFFRWIVLPTVLTSSVGPARVTNNHGIGDNAHLR